MLVIPAIIFCVVFLALMLFTVILAVGLITPAAPPHWDQPATSTPGRATVH